MRIIVDKTRCPQNHPCPARVVCPVDAVIQKGYRAPIIDDDKCIKCRKCVLSCPMGAIQESE